MLLKVLSNILRQAQDDGVGILLNFVTPGAESTNPESIFCRSMPSPTKENRKHIMLAKLAYLHLRWVALFSFVAFTSIGIGQLQSHDIGKLGQFEFWAGLAPVFSVCILLALVMPWAVFMIDPRRTDAPSVPALLKYWKVS